MQCLVSRRGLEADAVGLEARRSRQAAATMLGRRFAVIALLSMSACFPRELEPAAPPAALVPNVPSLPTEPAPPRHGRVLLATEREPAVVSLVKEAETVEEVRVTEGSAEPGAVHVEPTRGIRLVGAAPLCVTPCAVDVPVGAHRFVFASTTDRTRRSVTTLGVSEGTTAVRHVMAETKPMEASWLLGFFGAFVGTPLTLGGATALGFGTFGDIERAQDARSMQLMGGVTLAVGAALLTSGILVMSANRGSHREGATTTFAVPPRDPLASGRDDDGGP